MRMPVTAADKRMSQSHNKATIKLENKKMKDHLKAAKKTSNPQSKAFNRSHAMEHKKVLKARVKYAKKVGY